MNDPQRHAFVGYLVIHLLRNPALIDVLRRQTWGMLEEAAQDAEVTTGAMAHAAYDDLFRNNALYDRFARPLLWSQWAIVRSEAPVFVLPDTFCARGAVDGEPRLIVPLTPSKCFVTLSATEEEKRIVPYSLRADDRPAFEISNLLSASAAVEVLSHPTFTPVLADDRPSFVGTLRQIDQQAAGRSSALSVA